MNLIDHLKDKIAPLLTDSTTTSPQHHDSDWLVNHTDYTEADDNALDMLETMHTLPAFQSVTA